MNCWCACGSRPPSAQCGPRVGIRPPGKVIVISPPPSHHLPPAAVLGGPNSLALAALTAALVVFATVLVGVLRVAAPAPYIDPRRRHHCHPSPSISPPSWYRPA